LLHGKSVILQPNLEKDEKSEPTEQHYYYSTA